MEAQFNEKLKLLTEQEAKVTLDLAQETIQILAPDTGTPEGKGKAKREEYLNVLLGDRAKEFEGFIDEKRLELRDLYNEWNVTQGKIIALAIKILGPTNVVLDPKHYAGYSELSGIVKEASAEYKKNVEGLHEEGRKIGEIESSLQEVTKKTSNEINAIHQVSLLDTGDGDGPLTRLDRTSRRNESADRIWPKRCASIKRTSSDWHRGG